MKKLYILFIFLSSFAYAQEPFIFTWEVHADYLNGSSAVLPAENKLGSQ